MAEINTPSQEKTRPAKTGRRKRRLWIAATTAVAAVAASLVAFGTASADDNPQGIDVSAHQGAVDWGAVAGSGKQFAMIKATEGTGYISGSFGDQYVGSYNAGLIRGAYHFALPDASSGADQANYFADHGGAWSKDDHTLPGSLDIEWNPYGDTCYGKSQGDMVAWIHDFVNTYKNRTGRDAIIYTAASWWNQCTGGSGDFAATNPLWVAHYGVNSPAIPGGFSVYTFWQFTSTGSVPGVGGNCDVSTFNGSHDRLLALANGT
ncbi:MAG TPA: lysozyme [Stackebrandtia sp.]|jgi:GH25 family lysozyme M1 (1,4-beta-N-acetylmuramidase)|uniref:lysozyme n=1 Tax=Stackebrandtia sp. TaxID=2023065 RepID=UPI002D27DEAE|nr:lysozyme [Stackebrandtia sp.]HZE39498.1 lysozyme [Stackebrandtia sp.]